MTAPSIKEALERARRYVEHHPGTQAQYDLRAIDVALATFQPDGERLEAIARALAEKWPGDYMQGDDECEREPNALAYETADLILASGLVQNEAGWRDISTAPKDGTRILWSCGDDKMSVIHWPEYDLCFESGYWQPLPAPPIRSARDGGAS